MSEQLNKRDLLSRLEGIDANAPDIRAVEQELQHAADIRRGLFDMKEERDAGEDEESRKIFAEGVKLHDDDIRKDERDKIYKRLESMAEVYSGQSDEWAVPWSDIDSLFAELKGE